MYPRFGICSYDSCDRPHAISLGNEAKAGDDSGLGEGCHLFRSQLLHLTLGKVTPKSQEWFCEHVPAQCINMSLCRCVNVYVPKGQILQFGPDFLSVEPEGVLLAHTLSDIEAGSDYAYNIAIQKPSQELTQDLCPV